jgi:hypothetical protein
MVAVNIPSVFVRLLSTALLSVVVVEEEEEAALLPSSAVIGLAAGSCA